MDVYFATNLIVSVVTLLTLRYGNGSNSASYYLSLFAILSWFVPYNLISQLIPEQVLTTPIVLSLSQVTTIASTSQQNTNIVELSAWLTWGFISLALIGAVAFLTQLIHSLRWQRRLLDDRQLIPFTGCNSKSQAPVYLSNQVASGLLIGVFKPVILVSSKLKNTQLFELIVAHENQHLKAHDNIRLIILELAARLFWWNPFMQKLVSANRFYIEARCDEQASTGYGKDNYLRDLNALILCHHADQSNTLTCAALTKGKHNLTRVKRLKEKGKMTIKNKLCYLFAALATLVTISWSAVSTAEITEKNLDPNRLGALVTIDAKIIVNPYSEGQRRETRSQIVLWIDFAKEASFKINDDFLSNLKVTEHNNYPFFEMELIELNSDENEKMAIAQPKLTLNYGENGMIEFYDPEVSQNFYSIKVTIDKATQPEAQATNT